MLDYRAGMVCVQYPRGRLSMGQQGVNIRLSLGNKTIDKKNFANIAEEAIQKNNKGWFRGLTVSKLRNIYGMIMNIYTKTDSSNFESCAYDIQYLKVKMAYEAGRERSVKGFLEDTSLMTALDDIKTYEEFLLYCRYAESLVAYFKFFGGRE